MKIEYLRITIKPYQLPQYDTKELQIDVKANLETFHFRHIYEPNDFESVFDRLMDEAKRQILKLVEDYDAPGKSTV